MKFIKKYQREQAYIKASNALYDAIVDNHFLKWENLYYVTSKFIGAALLADKDIRRFYDVSRGMFYWEMNGFVKIYEFDDYNHECVKLF